MSFVQREYDKLHKLCVETPPGELYDALYIAKGALAWAVDPDCYASPSEYVRRFYNSPADGTKGTGIVYEDLKVA